ncbi:hypothetical protein ACLIYP_12735 [Streptomyces nanhaiensis]
MGGRDRYRSRLPECLREPARPAFKVGREGWTRFARFASER